MLPEILDLPLTKEEREIVGRAHEVCREFVVPRRAELDESCEFPEDIMAQFRDAGLFRAMFPAEFDGLGFHPLTPMLIAESIAEYCLATATIFGASTTLAALPIRLGGTDEQKRKYLPRLASGEWFGSFAVTEPDAGSDITSIATTAVKRGDRYVLNGMKKWITNAGRSDLYCVFAITAPGQDPRSALSCFIVEKGTPGLSFGKLENKLGLRCTPNRPVILENVEVPEENLVGLKPNKGFNLLFETLTRSRVGVATFGVGVATGAYKEAAKYTRRRKQFGKRVIEFQVVQHMLADMLMKIETARMLTYKAGWYAHVLAHKEASKFSAMAKCYASEIAMQVTTDALQLHGGYGFVKDCPAEKMFRDAKILAIYEGTNQMLKNDIAMSIVQEAARFQ